MTRKAFTLIELLVVIAIIGLLMAVLMPGLQKAKQQALRVICKSNLHSYGLAGNAYMIENDERFPDPWQSLYDSCQGRCSGVCTDPSHQTFPGEVQRFCRWHNAEFSLSSHPEYAGPLWPYLQNEEVNLCPVFKKVSKQRGAEHPLHVADIPIDPQFGYSQNAYLGARYFGGVLKMSEVRVPARTFFFAEENMWVINQSTGYEENLSTQVLNDTALLARTQPEDENDYDDCFATFHTPPGGDLNEGLGNAVMLDGSIEPVRPQDNGTFKYAWPKTANALR